MIAVTGAAGHLGNVLVRRLVDGGESVRCIVSSPRKLDDPALSGLDVERAAADVRDAVALERAFRGADLVYHLAAIIALVPGHEREMEEVNVGGTGRVVEACRKVGVRRLVYVSSIHAFDAVPLGTTICEDSPITGRSALGTYGRTKALATLAVLDAVRRGLDAVVVCPTGMIGPYDFHLSPMGRVVLAYLRGHAWVDLPGEYDFVDVRDVAAGLLSAAGRGRRGESYLLAGEVVSVHRLYQLLADLTNIPPPPVALRRGLLEFLGRLGTLYGKATGRAPILTQDAVEILFSNSAVSHHKARDELGFRPRPLRDTLRDTVAWLKEHEGLVASPSKQI
jgi:dihydroflavonol-4-reductase